MWSYSKRLACMVANLSAKESEKRRQSTSEKLEGSLRKHYSNTVSTSRTPPRRGHHGNTHGCFILIKFSSSDLQPDINKFPSAHNRGHGFRKFKSL